MELHPTWPFRLNNQPAFNCTTEIKDQLPAQSRLATHVRDDDGEFGVEGVVDFAHGAFVTPEGVVVLTVLGVRVPDGGEQLVPGCGVGVGLRDAVGGLPANQKQTLSGLIIGQPWELSEASNRGYRSRTSLKSAESVPSMPKPSSSGLEGKLQHHWKPRGGSNGQKDKQFQKNQ